MFFSGLILALALPGLVFLLRSPVLILGDAPFAGLYGAKRIRQRQTEASLALFRRVKPVIVAESAGPDLVVFAVEEADPRPYGVIFPHRYADGARRYAGQFPQVRVVVLDTRPEDGGAGPNTGVFGEPVVIRTQRREDFFRAGLFAGVISRPSGGGILVFQERSLSPADKSAFLAGLRELGIENLPRFLNSPAEYPGLPEASCVVLTGPAAEFLDRNLKVPVILFSWADPAQSARETLIVFDDSPWALAAGALRAAKNGESGLPSDILFPRGRIADKRLLRDLKRAAGAALP